ncbi:MAG: sensor histidine kinase [Sphingobacteriales bacterium]|nr:MAG: sensor histidine kinase [Sphingobacteriales bacterium]
MEITFSVSPRILRHLGEDLIKNESIALLELVKNSYDACATACTIYFHFEHSRLARIILKDNGLGMNAEIIRNAWLTIGTDYKLKNNGPNVCGRAPLGEKGIGRLGVHKLGNLITLISKSADNSEAELHIDWRRLDLANEISDFKLELLENSKPTVFKDGTGTQIIIDGLKTAWDVRELRDVYRNLNSLNSPFSHSNESFRVEITSNTPVFADLPDFDEILESALYFGHCKLRGNKIVEFKYDFKPWETLEKSSDARSKTLEDLLEVELTIVDSEGNEIDLDANGIGEIEFDIAIFETETQIFSFVNAEKKSIKEYLKQNGGVRVYRDGVRVYDYGERDNDWLGIDLKRVKKVGGNVSNNIVIGAVKLDRRQSTGLREKTNREGFIENENYFALVESINYLLGIFVRERNIDKQLLSSLYKKHKVTEPVLSDLSEIENYVNEKIENQEIKNELINYISRITSQYNEVKDVLIKSANAGLNLSVVVHEIEKIMASLMGSIERKEITKAHDLTKRLEKIIRGYSALIKRSDIKSTPLSLIVSQALETYEFRFSDHEITVFTNWRESKLSATLAQSEATSILTNLLDNAIFWLKYAKRRNRFISVYITDQIKGFASIVVSDNGPGFTIPPEIAIKPFMTGKPHNIGSGLGLHVANEMMISMKGRLEFLDKNEIQFPSIITSNNATKAIVALCFPIK